MALSTNVVKFPLSKRFVRPFFSYDTGTEEITMLFDSGANVPVWCSGKDLLYSAYDEVQETTYFQEIRGFGKQPEAGQIFKLPRFVLKSDNQQYVLHNLYLVLLDRPEIGCDFLICPRMFEKSDYLVTNRGQKTISFVSDKEEYYCTPVQNADGSFQKFVVWAEEKISDK